MPKYYLFDAATSRLEEIYEYSLDTFGQQQADKYLDGFFDHFTALAERRALWRKIPREFEIQGYFSRYGSHLIYFAPQRDKVLGIRTILHVNMDQAIRLFEDESRNDKDDSQSA